MIFVNFNNGALRRRFIQKVFISSSLELRRAIHGSEGLLFYCLCISAISVAERFRELEKVEQYVLSKMYFSGMKSPSVQGRIHSVFA